MNQTTTVNEAAASGLRHAKDSNGETPWQLRMFRKTLKKQQRLRELRRLIGRRSAGEACLLVTCGDNNGAMNWHLRELGGQWTWADLEERSIPEMSALLGDPVHHVRADRLPFDGDRFDCVVTIDVHEHVTDPQSFTAELVRVAKDRGRLIVTVPGGERHKLVNALKNAVGMTMDEYGHTREGYSVAELKELMTAAQIEPQRVRTFSRFFTELLELGLNFVYVKKMAKRSQTAVAKGTIAPATQAQLKSVGKAYRLYSLVFPLVWLISQLDRLLFFTRGYVVVVAGTKRTVS